MDRLQSRTTSQIDWFSNPNGSSWCISQISQRLRNNRYRTGNIAVTSIAVNFQCKALVEAKVYDYEGIENLRFLLVWERVNPPEFTEKLNLSGNEIKSLRDLPAKIILFPNVTQLDLSNNKIKHVEVKVPVGIGV